VEIEMSTKTTIENDEKTTVGDRFCLDYLPGLSKEYYYEFADWKVRKCRGGGLNA